LLQRAACGSVTVANIGDSCDNALAVSVIGLFKTGVIRRRGTWRNIEAVEFATLEWVDWFNNRRLLRSISDVPPVEFEQAYYRRHENPVEGAGLKH
jgi:transposase InsO family protein